MDTRILPTSNVPKILWNNEVLHCPPVLSERYVASLTREGLLEQARHGTTADDIHGGQSSEETRRHFTHRFGVSVGRVQFVTIDPRDLFRSVSNALLSSFAEGPVALLDLPCGSGAATCSLISCLVELRKSAVLPQLPLSIVATGADYSAEAVRIAGDLVNSLTGIAAQHAITVQWNSQVWDATRTDQTARLVDNWFGRSPAGAEHFVLISNFSGALSTEQIFGPVMHSLEHIVSRLHDRKSTVVWVEPASLTAQRRVLPRILEYFRRWIPWVSPETSPGSPIPTAEYQVCHPVTQLIHSSSVAVQQFHRTGQ